MAKRSDLRDLALRRAVAERKSFSGRPDAAAWRAAFAAKVASEERWVRAMRSLFEPLDSKLNVKAGVKEAQRQWVKAERVRKAEEPSEPVPPPATGAAASYTAVLAAGGPGAVIEALSGGVKVQDYAEGAMAVYLKLALELAEESGRQTLEALGRGQTWDWTTYRDFARDEYAVRGSKILQHAYGSHLDALARLVIRKCDPRNPLTIQQLTKQIRQEWSQLAKFEAERIARTEAAAVWERMNYYALERNGVEKVEWLIAQGPALDAGKVGPVCPKCLKAKADGPYPVSGPGSLTDETMPPRHPNCFPAGTVVFGPTHVGGVERFYSGTIVTLTTRRHRVSVTPNHPILTPDGWVPAGNLREGGYVIGSAHRQRSRGAVLDDHNVPAPIEQVVRALRPQRLGMGLPSAVEFHGDGVPGEVYVVRADRLLQRESHPAFGEPAVEEPCLLCGTGSSKLIGSSALDLLVKPHDPSASRAVGSSDLERYLLGSHLAPLQALRLSATARLDPGSLKTPVDGRPGSAEHLSESIHRHALSVQADKLVSVDRYSFSGHVFNLETVDNWYSANGIVAHNCRCTLVPVLTPEWLPPIVNEGPATLEPVTKAVGWAAPATPKAPTGLSSPLAAAASAAATGRKKLSAAQIAQRRAAARKKKRRA